MGVFGVSGEGLGFPVLKTLRVAEKTDLFKKLHICDYIYIETIVKNSRRVGLFGYT